MNFHLKMALDRKFVETDFFKDRSRKAYPEWLDDVRAVKGANDGALDCSDVPLVLIEVNAEDQRILAMEESLSPLDYFGTERWEKEIYPFLQSLFERFFASKEEETLWDLELKFNEFFSTSQFSAYLEKLAEPQGHLLQTRALVKREIIWVLNTNVEIHRPRLHYPTLVQEFKKRYLSGRA